MFTSEQKQQLRTFCDVCDAIAGCRFIKDFFNQRHHIFVGTLPDGTVKDEWPRYDDDDFRAFLTHYRKLRLEGETKFERIANLVKRVSDTNDRETLDQFKSEIREEGESWWGARLSSDDGHGTLLNQVEVEKLILYGDVFHCDPEKREQLRQMLNGQPLTQWIAFHNYLRFARTVVAYAKETAKLIRERGYLD